mgnify:CR=1 FL=1|tara:strand:+ start:259 stop:609 length:351 start_codon:yes stop_codon:yes gene_type:complete
MTTKQHRVYTEDEMFLVECPKGGDYENQREEDGSVFCDYCNAHLFDFKMMDDGPARWVVSNVQPNVNADEYLLTPHEEFITPTNPEGLIPVTWKNELMTAKLVNMITNMKTETGKE